MVRFFLMMFAWALAEGVLIFYIPLFVEAKIDNLALTGILLAIGPVSALLTDMLFGFVTEVSDHRKFFYLGIVMCLSIIPLLLWGMSVLPISILLVLWGAEFEMFVNFGTPLYLAKNVSKEGFPRIASINYTLRNLGYFLGPLLADYLYLQLGRAEWLVFFLMACYLIVTSYAYLNLHVFNKVRYREHATKLSLYSEIRIIRKHFNKVVPFIIVGFGAAAFEAIFFVFGPIELSNMTNISGIIMSLIMLANVIVPPIIVPMLPKKYMKVFLFFSSIFILCGTIAMSSVQNEWVLAALIFTLFSLLASSYVASNALFLQALAKIKDNEEDEVASVNSIGPNLAYVLIAIFGGLLLKSSTFAFGALLGAVLLFLSTLVFLKLYHDHK